MDWPKLHAAAHNADARLVRELPKPYRVPIAGLHKTNRTFSRDWCNRPTELWAMPWRSKSGRAQLKRQQAFPIRLRIDNPWSGTGTIRWTDAEVWLKEHVGPGDFARHSDGQRMAFYFRTADAAKRFLEAFPDLKLADYTEHVDHLRAARRGADYGTFAEMGKRAR